MKPCKKCYSLGYLDRIDKFIGKIKVTCPDCYGDGKIYGCKVCYPDVLNGRKIIWKYDNDNEEVFRTARICPACGRIIDYGWYQRSIESQEES